MMLGQKKQNPAATTTAPSPTKSPDAFTSIKDALAKSMSLQCDYSEGEGKTIAYIKGGAIRTDGSTPKGITTSVIVKDGMMYYWSGKQGMKFKFDVSEMMKDIPKVTPKAGETTTQKPGDVVNALEAYKKNCKVSTVSDSMFVPPTNVTFVDQTKMMQDAQKAMKNVTPGQGMSEEQIKALQKQYQQSSEGQ